MAAADRSRLVCDDTEARATGASAEPTATGNPVGIGVESNSMQASPVPGCLQALIAEWRFPRPAAGNVEVSFPFVFRSIAGSL